MALSRGCTIGLIIVGIIVLILIVAAILIYVNRDRIMEASINFLVDQAESELVKDVPSGYTEADVHRIMNDLKAGIKEGEINEVEVRELSNSFQAAIADQQISREEGRELLVTIQEALGQTPPPLPEEMPADTTMMDTLRAAPEGG